MTAGDLLKHLRMRIAEMGLTAVFDSLLFTYIDNAYNLFVKEMGGVSDEEAVTVVTGATEFVVPDYVLKVKSAGLLDGSFPSIINRADTKLSEFNSMFGKGGEIKYILIGTKRGVAKVACSPVVDTLVTLDIDRLPKNVVATPTDTVSDVPKLFQLDILDFAVAQLLAINSDPKIRAQAPIFEARGYAKAHEARDYKSREQSKVFRQIVYGGI